MSAASSQSHDGATYSDGVKVVQTTLEQPIQIHLWEDRTRGELWVPTYDPTGLELLADDYLRIAGNNAVDNGQRTFEFKAVKLGTHRVLFEKRMGWKFTAEDRRVFDVTVSGPSSRKGV
ncbi:MAG: protease inhibitor I42 family protein [Nitrospiraceae bacterium]|nr:protease inhibitor I42 family protein [Nitrospiraceae bacterium]